MESLIESLVASVRDNGYSELFFGEWCGDLTSNKVPKHEQLVTAMKERNIETIYINDYCDLFVHEGIDSSTRQQLIDMSNNSFIRDYSQITSEFVQEEFYEDGDYDKDEAYGDDDGDYDEDEVYDDEEGNYDEDEIYMNWLADLLKYNDEDGENQQE